MPPTDDNMPDFDSMSPEELQAWMETLAERQGAYEGFTTDQRMEVAEIDPDTVDVEDNYIPYGKTAEEWAEIQERERQEKAERLAARQAQAPSAPAAPPPQPEPVAAAPAPAASAEPAMPDFDSMSPEEIQAWMETLAERQGAHEGFTTETRMDIAEIDPNSVDIQDNYIPYGKTPEEWAEIQERERQEKAERFAARQAPPTAAAPSPAPEPPAEPAAEDAMGWLADLAPDAAVDDPLGGLDLANLGDDLDLSGLGDDIAGDLDLDALDLGALGGQETDPIEWLDGLVDEQSSGVPAGDDRPFPELDTADADTPAIDSGDPLEWLESLAHRVGASEDELTTDAAFDLPDAPGQPVQEEPIPRMPGFDGVDDLDQPLDADDPAAWLDSLAASHQREGGPAQEAPSPAPEAPAVPQPPADEPPSTEAIMADLNRGVTDPNSIKGWMDALLEEGASRDVPDYVDPDEEEEIQLEPQIPDWLRDQAGDPPADMFADTAPGADSEQIAADLGLDELTPAEAEAGGDMPDWLKPEETEAMPAPISEVDMPDWLMDAAPVDDAGAAAALPDFDAAPIPEPEIPDWLRDDQDGDAPVSAEDEVARIFSPPSPDDIDTDDPWVEAFEMERQAEELGLEDLPDAWLEGQAQVAQPPAAASASLPDNETLPHGEPEALPEWLMDAAPPAVPPAEVAAPAAAIATPTPTDDLPDWLRESQAEYDQGQDVPDWLGGAGIEKVDEVPDWLLDTITGETAVVEPEAPAPKPPTPAPVPQAVSPAPVIADDIDADAALQEAHEQLSAANVAGALAAFETVIRANAHLDRVVADVSELLKDKVQKHNAAVYRVLGDALMRQGRLQAALDTYRKALNLL